MTVEVIFPGGNARRLRVPVTVRPVTATFTPAPPPGAEALSPEPSVPAAPERPKKLVRRKKSPVAVALRHRPCQGACEAPGAKAADHPRTPPATPKDPMVNT